jgi:hypothetical protein
MVQRAEQRLAARFMARREVIVAFICSCDFEMSFFALYQGTTSVVPERYLELETALAAASFTQKLKPNSFRRLSARVNRLRKTQNRRARRPQAASRRR